MNWKLFFVVLGLPLWASVLSPPQALPRSPQDSEYSCPLNGSPQIRQGDSVAATGGRFDSDRPGGKHGALDLNSVFGKTVFAVRDGKATIAKTDWDPKGLGSAVVLDHGDGEYSIYGHLSSLEVAQGAKVSKGQVIGKVGYSGNAQALKTAGLPPHLHFALLRAGKSGLGPNDKPISLIKEWGDMWKLQLGAELNGPVNPGLFMPASCWTGSTRVGAPGEK